MAAAAARAKLIAAKGRTESEAVLQRLRQMRAQDSFRLKRPALINYPADSSGGSAGGSSSRKIALPGAGAAKPAGRPGSGWSPAFA